MCLFGAGRPSTSNVPHRRPCNFYRPLVNPLALEVDPGEGFHETKISFHETETEMKILIVDDETFVQRLMKEALGPRYSVLTAGSVSEALVLSDERPDLAIIDLQLVNGLEGLELIRPFRKKGIKCVVVSSHDDDSIIEQCYEAGCDLFYAKGAVLSSIHQIINDLLLRDSVQFDESLFTTSFITEDPQTKFDVRRVFQAFMQGTNILVSGETGTGKSELAGIFHRESRVAGNFVAINCAGIPRELLESELFGHSKGAFTGADRASAGKLKLADKGVLFLDEINSLSLEMQAKLLKAVEEKRFYPVGSERVTESDFKLIAASNENLFDLVAQGKFRLDLLQRLCGSMLELKPLRERAHDTIRLIKHFNVTQRKFFLDPEVRIMIQAYTWPGNSREVKRFVDFCVTLPTGKVTPSHFQQFIQQSRQESASAGPDIQRWVEASLERGLDAVTEEFRELIINEVQKRENKNVTAVMRELKISTRQFYKYVNKRS